MTDRINVDFINRKKLDTISLPDAETIFIDQARARFAETAGFITEYQSTGGIVDADQLAAEISDINKHMSDHELLQALHVGNRLVWEINPVRAAALVACAYARETVLEKLSTTDPRSAAQSVA